MSYDETLATRVRAALAGRDDVREQQMFGGIAFMVSGHMAVGIVGERLMLRLGDDGADAALNEAHVAPMDFTGRPMSTMVYVEPAGVADDAALDCWVERALAFNGTLRAKPPK
jgi:TfoX/Sxy family transcriptional regulator of competence genes